MYLTKDWYPEYMKELLQLCNKKASNIIKSKQRNGRKWAKDLNRCLPKRRYKKGQKACEKVPNIINIREMQIKWICKHPLEWLEFERLTPPNVGKVMKQPELPYIVSGNIKWLKQLRRRSGSFL